MTKKGKAAHVRRFEISTPVVGEEVCIAQDVSHGKVSSIHSDGSVDVVLTNGAIVASVCHLSQTKESQGLPAEGWFSRGHDFGMTE